MKIRSFRCKMPDVFIRTFGNRTQLNTGPIVRLSSVVEHHRTHNNIWSIQKNRTFDCRIPVCLIFMVLKYQHWWKRSYKQMSKYYQTGVYFTDILYGASTLWSFVSDSIGRLERHGDSVLVTRRDYSHVENHCIERNGATSALRDIQSRSNFLPTTIKIM